MASKATRTEPRRCQELLPGHPTDPVSPQTHLAPSPPETQGLRLSYLLWSWIEEAGPEPGAPWGPSASCPTSLRLGLQSSAQPAPLWACDCSQVGSWAAAGGHAAGAQRLSPPCSRHPPQGRPRPRGRGQLRPPLEPWTRMWCRAESVRQARSPCDPASGDMQGDTQGLGQTAGCRAGGQSTTHRPRATLTGGGRAAGGGRGAGGAGGRGSRGIFRFSPWVLEGAREPLCPQEMEGGVGPLATCPSWPQGEAGLTQEPSRWQQDSWTLQTKSLPFVWSRNSHLKKVSLEAPWAGG